MYSFGIKSRCGLGIRLSCSIIIDQVLSNEKTRREYDLMRKTSESPQARDPAPGRTQMPFTSSNLCVIFICSSTTPAVCESGAINRYVLIHILVFSFFLACSHILLLTLLFATVLICLIGATAWMQKGSRYAGK